MEGHVSAPILGTPAWYAQREIELLERLARQPQAVVQLWLRKVRIQSIANAQRHAGKQAMGSQAAAPQVAGGEARPKTAAAVNGVAAVPERLQQDDVLLSPGGPSQADQRGAALGALRAEPALGRGPDVEAPLGVVLRLPFGPRLEHQYVEAKRRGLLGGFPSI